jgi:Inosine-uridine preferring nucleoside hydrolase
LRLETYQLTAATVTRGVDLTKIHFDTDIGGDMDDVRALAMILKWPDLEITGVTTVSDEQGRRAGYVHFILSLVGRTDIPFAAGADVSGDYYRYELGYPPDEENWPESVTPRPGSPEKAVSLLKRSIEKGAVIVAAGPYTNLMLLEKTYPGILKQSDLFLAGGHVFDVPVEYPQWSNEMDYKLNSTRGVSSTNSITVKPVQGCPGTSSIFNMMLWPVPLPWVGGGALSLIQYPSNLKQEGAGFMRYPTAMGFPHAWSRKLTAMHLMSFGVMSSVLSFVGQGKNRRRSGCHSTCHPCITQMKHARQIVSL